VEVSANVSEQFGMEWRCVGNLLSPKPQAFGGTSFTGAGGANINTVAANPLGATGSGLAIGVMKGTISFGGTTFLNLGLLARALQAQADTNILSTPNLLTMDNEEAEIIVGQNVPFLTGQNSTQGGLANPFQTIERKDVGLTLRVTPQISEGDTVRLKLYQEISSIATNAGAQGNGLITNKRSIKTVILANDGQIIVLGGLLRDDNTSSVQRVPCLGSTPILGEPFKFTDNSHRKTNLMVFLKPHIIKSSNQIEALTNQKYMDIKKLYERPIKGGTLLFPQEQKMLPTDIAPTQHLNSEVSKPVSPKESK
jgi:general secretion pathway protein D